MADTTVNVKFVLIVMPVSRIGSVRRVVVVKNTQIEGTKHAVANQS